MRVALWGSILLASMAMIIAGCEGGRTPPNQGATVGQPVPVFREFRGQQGPFPDRGFFVVQRPETWEVLWGNRQAPDVDFSRQTVLVALMGQQPTAGYDVRITDVRATGERVIAFVTETRPQAGQEVERVISYPYHMAVVPKLTQPVEFRVAGMVITQLPILDYFQGQNSNAVNPQTAVIRDATAWRTFWATTFGATQAVPEVDFAQNMAVIVLMGRRPTGGYVANIAYIDRDADRLTVNYRLISPAPGAVVTQAITSPYAIAIIPTSPLPVAFRNLTNVPLALVQPQ